MPNSNSLTSTCNSSQSKRTTSRRIRSSSRDRNSDPRSSSRESRQSHLLSVISLRWSTKITAWLHPPAELTTMLEYCQLWTGKNSSHRQVSPCTDTVTLLSIFYPHNPMRPFKWCRSRKSLMSHSLISVVLTPRNRKWGKPLNCHWLILSFIRKSVLTLQRVYSCMDLQVQERPWWPRP